MKSWTRTLNLDDAHELLALAQPGLEVQAWARASIPLLAPLSQARRSELVRILRDGFLDLDDDSAIAPGLFLTTYLSSPALAQIDLVYTQWALSHPIALLAVEKLVRPALALDELEIPLDDVEQLVADHVITSSDESKRKTRTVLLGALEGIGVLHTSGTGQHRAIRAARGQPHPITFGYLIGRELAQRGLNAMLEREVLETSLPVRLTCCEPAHTRACVDALLQWGRLERHGDEIRLPAPSTPSSGLL